MIFNEIGVPPEQGSPKNRAGGLVAGHQSFICGELHHPSGLQGKRFVRCRIGFTCCKEGCENNLEKLQKAGFPHMQTQGCTCIPSGTSPHADAAQPVSVTLHSGAPPPSPGDRHQGILSGNSGAGRIRTQGRVRLETTRGSTADSTPDAEVREDVTRKTRKRRRTTAAVWKNPSPMMRCKRGGEGFKHPEHCGREASTTVPQLPAINPSRSPFPASAPGRSRRGSRV